jgi:glycine cleavage system H protein
MKFTKDHEWLKIEGDIATIGISEYAAESLGELVYVELPKIGNKYSQGEVFAVVESSKSASDVYLPLAGEVVEINEALISSPELVNNSSYEDGWIAKIKISSLSKEGNFMSLKEYSKYLQDK